MPSQTVMASLCRNLKATLPPVFSFYTLSHSKSDIFGIVKKVVH